MESLENSYDYPLSSMVSLQDSARYESDYKKDKVGERLFNTGEKPRQRAKNKSNVKSIRIKTEKKPLYHIEKQPKEP